MAHNCGSNHGNSCTWSFGDFAKYIQFGLANPVFIDAAMFNPLLPQLFPSRTVDKCCTSQCNPQQFRGGASSPGNSSKEQTASAVERQCRYKYTKLPTNDDCPPSYEDCVQPGYTSLKEK